MAQRISYNKGTVYYFEDAVLDLNFPPADQFYAEDYNSLVELISLVKGMMDAEENLMKKAEDGNKSGFIFKTWKPGTEAAQAEYRTASNRYEIYKTALKKYEDRKLTLGTTATVKAAGDVATGGISWFSKAVGSVTGDLLPGILSIQDQLNAIKTGKETAASQLKRMKLENELAKLQAQAAAASAEKLKTIMMYGIPAALLGIAVIKTGKR